MIDKILLVGNPNVGKSAVFSRLTGVKVIASNYPGTTVEYTQGYMRIEDQKIAVVDVPGTYSMETDVKAEQVAVEMMEKWEHDPNTVYVNVLDSTNLERNLSFTLQLIRKKVRLILVLNFWDEAKHTGVRVDESKLEEILGIPVVHTSAITGEGIKQFVERIPEASLSNYDCCLEDHWKSIGSIIEKVQDLRHKHHTLGEFLGDASVHPIWGIFIAILVLTVTFSFIRFVGESLIKYILDPVFNTLWTPLVLIIHSALAFSPFLQKILIGTVVDGQIPYLESFGLLSTGLYVPLAMVFPYTISFYFALGFLEDSGYLPRLGVMMDTLMHKLGIHGLAIIPMLLGIGCNVPGAMSTRILETRREKFIAATIMAIAIPCMAQIAMIFGLVGSYGTKALIMVFGSLFIVWITLGLLMNKIVKGESPEIFIEIPPYRLPYFNTLLKKLQMRVTGFLKEAIPFVLIGVIIVNIMYTLGIIQMIGSVTKPVITGIMGLPEEAVGALVVGFLRKDVAVGMLLPLGLTMKQMVIASVALTMYFPCIATFTVLVKELGLKDMTYSAIIMMASTVIVGGVLNFIL